MVGLIAVIFVLGGLAFVAFVRLSPSDPARWHLPVEARESTVMAGGAVRVVPGEARGFARLHAAFMDLPRTQVLTGRVEEGRITYVTRSRLIGFPDYTTIEIDGGEIRAFARLRFGQSDLGVNAARLDQVFAAAGL